MRDPAVVPLDGFYRRTVDRAGRWTSRAPTTSARWKPRSSASCATSTASRSWSRRPRSCDRTCGAARRGVRHAGPGRHRRRKAARPTCSRPSRSSSAFARWKATARPSCRRSCRSTSRRIAPPAETRDWAQVGTVGQPIPGVQAKIVDLETRRGPAASASSGMLLIKGPNVMKGYYKHARADRQGAPRRLVRHGRHGA